MAQNESLYHAYQDILERQSAELNPAQRKLLQNALRDFRLAGIGLPQERKEQFKALMERLAVLQDKLKCGTNCGSCVPEIKRIIRTATEARHAAASNVPGGRTVIPIRVVA